MNRSLLNDDDSSSSNAAYSSYDSSSSESFFRRHIRVFTVLGLIVAAFAAFLVGYVVAFQIHHKPAPSPPSNSTGPVYPAPLTIYISINGFRASYLDWWPQYLPAFRSIIANGVRAREMTPVMPSVTYPNHYTLATGLWPESHGIVGNDIWDPEWNATFELGTASEADGRWYAAADPVWVTAKRQGLKTAVYYWAGSDAEINGVRPDLWASFQGVDDDPVFPDILREHNLTAWLDSSACNLCMMHLDNIDHNGHGHGPNSTQVLQALITYDNWLQQLLDGLKARGLLQTTNLVVVSDHGMAPDYPSQGLSFLNYTNVTFRASNAGAFSALWTRSAAEAQQLAADLQSGLPHATTWLKDDVPLRYHFRYNRRIAPVIVQSDESWQIDDSYPAYGGSGGSHGFDPDLTSMKALFLAQGPAFKPNVLIPLINNTEVYQLVCQTLGITPNPNNGTAGFWQPYTNFS